MTVLGDASCYFPRADIFHPVVANGHGGASASWNGETIAEGGMDGHETLQAAWRAMTLHHALSFSERQMAVLGTIVEPLMRPMIQFGQDFALGRAT